MGRTSFKENVLSVRVADHKLKQEITKFYSTGIQEKVNLERM